jgi:hypothetical protein
MFLRTILLILALFSLNACDQKFASTTEEWTGKQLTSDFSVQRGKNPFLAYEHWVHLQLTEDKLQSTFEKITNTCINHQVGQCAVLQSSIRGGEHGYASIRLRLAPEAVAPFVALMGDSGKITEQSTTAEDLTDAVADNAKRLEMLQSYRDRLQQLEQNSENNVDSLIKIAEKLAEVQSQLEFAQGEKAALYQRLEQDILNINMGVERETGVLSPIRIALAEFTDNLSEAIASLITATAYLLPWSFGLIFLFYIIRFVRRKQHRKK